MMVADPRASSSRALPRLQLDGRSAAQNKAEFCKLAWITDNNGVGFNMESFSINHCALIMEIGHKDSRNQQSPTNEAKKTTININKTSKW